MKTANEKIDRKWHSSTSDSAQSLDSWAFRHRLIPDLTPAPKIWPLRKRSPTRIAGRCEPRGGYSVAPALYPAIISTGRFSGIISANYTSWYPHHNGWWYTVFTGRGSLLLSLRFMSACAAWDLYLMSIHCWAGCGSKSSPLILKQAMTHKSRGTACNF